MLAQLGTVQFNIEREERNTTVGKNDTIHLTGTCCPEIEGHDALRLMMKQMKPQLLIYYDESSGYSKSLGYWVIEGITDNPLYVSGSEDAARQQRFNMKLRWYGERVSMV